MKITALFGFFAIRLAIPALAIGIKTCQNCTEKYDDETLYFRRPITLHGSSAAGDSPRANPHPPPPPPPATHRSPPNTPAANDELWDKAGSKGCTLGWAMQAMDTEAGALYVPTRTSAASSYTTSADLIKWFWFPFPVKRVADSFHDLYSTWGIGWALQDLEISDYTTKYEGGKNYMVNIAHQSYHHDARYVDEQWYQADDEWCRATGASYSFTVNPEQGIIIGLNRESPRWASKERIPPVEARQQPQLNQFSDVAWITWKTMNTGTDWTSSPDVKGLKYFMSVSVTNADTQQIIKRALEANHWELSEWPGHTFERTWPEAKALLGSPNIQGFAYFLIQHKAEIGNMYLDRIQVFKGETKAELPCILIHVKQPVNQLAARIQQRATHNGVVHEHIFHANL